MDYPRILIVEDDATLSNQVAALLCKNGFQVEQRHDGHDGLQTAMAEPFDLILLDVLLPKLNGFGVLNCLRQSRQTPVIMLTACGAEEERIEGFSKGADDYLPKPFNFKELLLRVEALLRRTRGLHSPVEEKQQIEVGLLSLNKRNQRVRFDSVDIVLTPIQFRLLWLLVDNVNETLTKPFLYQSVLERSYSPYDRSLDMHLSRIRKKLVDSGMPSEHLMTVHGKGYRFS